MSEATGTGTTATPTTPAAGLPGGPPIGATPAATEATPAARQARGAVRPGPVSADAPAARERFSVGDAASELARRRREARQGGGRAAANGAAANGAANGAAPANGAANGHAAAAAVAAPGEGEQRTDAAAADGEDGGDALSKVLRDMVAARGEGEGAGEAAGADADAGGDAITLTIGGKQRRLSHAQIGDAVLKSEGFTQKTQELAGLAKTINEQKALIGELLPIMIPEMERLLKATETDMGGEPDWVKLAAAGDPAEYQRQEAAWLAYQARERTLAQMREASAREGEEARRRRLSAGHRDLVKLLPAWGDEKTRGALTTEIRSYAKRNGYSDSELNEIYEPRHIMTLLHALAWERANGGVRTRAAATPNAARGGLPATVPRSVETAQRDFEGKMSVSNAAQLLMARRAAGTARGGRQ